MRGVQLTKGHLASNGGLRGHSVGDSFPFIVFARGSFDDIEWCVKSPSGVIVESGLESASQAESMAIHHKQVKECLDMA